MRRSSLRAELRAPVVRWPGGCFASGYHWKDGVGPDARPGLRPGLGRRPIPTRSAPTSSSSWCRLVGCEPYICTNAGNGTPEEMSQWVEYCNATPGNTPDAPGDTDTNEPLDVRFWSIGNENYGGWEIGAKTPDQWGPLVRESAKLMRRRRPVGDADRRRHADRDWTLPLLEQAERQRRLGHGRGDRPGDPAPEETAGSEEPALPEVVDVTPVAYDWSLLEGFKFRYAGTAIEENDERFLFYCANVQPGRSRPTSPTTS